MNKNVVWLVTVLLLAADTVGEAQHPGKQNGKTRKIDGDT
jgi:hypothetical protein